MPSVFFRIFRLPTLIRFSDHCNPIAPLALIESDIRRFHSQGISVPRMVLLLRKHYDTDKFGIGWVLFLFVSSFDALTIKFLGEQS